MTNVYQVIGTYILELLRISVEIFYAHTILGKKKTKLSIAIAYLTVPLLVVIPYFLFSNVIINLIVTFAGFIIISLFFESTAGKKVFYSIIGLAISVAIDFIVGYIMKDNPGDMAYDFYMSSISVLLFLFSALVLALFRYKHDEVISFKHLSLLVIVLVVGIGSMILLERDYSLSRQGMVYVGSTYLITDFLIFYIYGALAVKLQKEEEIRQLIEQNRIYEFQIQSGIESDKRVKSLRHDMKNHLALIYHFAEIDDNVSLKKYINKMEEELIDATPYSSTGVSGIDGILNYKISQARNLGIDLSSKVTVPEDIVLSTYDMNIILGNLIDNAIEASARCVENGKAIDPIELSIKYDKSCLLIHITNSYIGNEKSGPDFLTSSKKDADNHGIGLNNVKRTLEKYNGDLCIQLENDKFNVKISMIINS